MTVIKICQSCGTPIKINGTNSDMSENQDYCRYCFENGQFTSNATMEEMIQHALRSIFRIKTVEKIKILPGG